MSMVTELVAALTDAERKIDVQISALAEYNMEIETVLDRIRDALSGSRQEYGINMVNQLISTKDEINRTINQLELSKQKIDHVRYI